MTPSRRLMSLAIDANEAFTKLYDGAFTVVGLVDAALLVQWQMPDAAIIDCKHSNQRLMLVTSDAAPGRVRVVVCEPATEKYQVEMETALDALSVNEVLEAMQKHFVH